MLKTAILSLLVLYAFPAPGAVVVSSERLLSDRIASTVDSASGPGEAIVCWTEGDSKIRVARVSATGERIGSPMIVAPGAGYQNYPHIAFDGVHYLVVWTEIPTEPAPFGTLSARLLNVDGSPASDIIVLSHSILLFQLGAPVTATFPPAIFWNGSLYLVVWNKGWSNNAAVTGAVAVTRDGVASEVTIPVRTGTSTQTSRFAVTTDATGDTLLAWEWTSDDLLFSGIDAAIFDRDLHVLSTITIDSASDVYGQPATRPLVPQLPAVAAGPAGFFVVWTKYANRPIGSELRGVRVDVTGHFVDPGPILLDSTTGSDFDWDPRVIWDGGGFVLAWKRVSSGSSAGIWGAQIASAGSVENVFSIAPGPQTNTLPGEITLSPLGSGRTVVAYVTSVVAGRVIYTGVVPRRRALRPA